MAEESAKGTPAVTPPSEDQRVESAPVSPPPPAAAPLPPEPIVAAIGVALSPALPVQSPGIGTGTWICFRPVCDFLSVVRLCLFVFFCI